MIKPCNLISSFVLFVAELTKKTSTCFYVVAIVCGDTCSRMVTAVLLKVEVKTAEKVILHCYKIVNNRVIRRALIKSILSHENKEALILFYHKNIFGRKQL